MFAFYATNQLFGKKHPHFMEILDICVRKKLSYPPPPFRGLPAKISLYAVTRNFFSAPPPGTLLHYWGQWAVGSFSAPPHCRTVAVEIRQRTAALQGNGGLGAPSVHCGTAGGSG